LKVNVANLGSSCYSQLVVSVEIPGNFPDFLIIPQITGKEGP